MLKPRIIQGICEFCGVPAKDCAHYSGRRIAPTPIKKYTDETLSNLTIPKIIYTTWISDKPLPEKFYKYIRSWLKIMPDYEIRIIDIKNYPHNKFIDECISKKMFVVAGHYARVQRIFETGGIYFDIDVETIKPFDRFLNDKMFVGFENDKLANNAVFGAVAGHPFLKEQMKFLDSFDLDSKNVELETGIRAFANLYRDYDWGKIITSYPARFFYPYNWDEQFSPECITPETYAIHHWAHSWNNMVSIVIPCYKQAQYLTDAITSCLEQSVAPLEIIVVNDGSPDNTSDVAIRFNPKFVKLIEKPNGGLSSARNAGIAMAKGKYIITLDADDKLHPDFIKKTIGINDVVSTKLKTFGDFESVWDPPSFNPKFEDFYRENQINCCSLFLREIWEKVGGFDENMKLGYEDWDFWTRAAYSGYKFSVITEALFLYRKHGESMVNGTRDNHDKIRTYMLNKYKDYEIKAA